MTTRSTSSGPPQVAIGQPFNPYKVFNALFVPAPLARFRGVSCGAKLAYGRLARYAGENGRCFPSIATLAAEIGLKANQARTYIHELRDKRLINIKERPGRSAFYTFLWHEAFDAAPGPKRMPTPLQEAGGVPLQEAGDPPLREAGDPPLRETGDPPLREAGDEESAFKENHHQPQKSEENHPIGSSFVSRSPRHAPISSSVDSLSGDDDEKPEAPSASPWEKIRAKFRNASCGQEMRSQDDVWLREQLEVRGVSPEALLELIAQNPLGGFRSPIAGLKWLVKKFQAKTHSGSQMEVMVNPVPHMVPPTKQARCEKCATTGRVIQDTEGLRSGEHCDCRLGAALKGVEQRPPMDPKVLQHFQTSKQHSGGVER